MSLYDDLMAASHDETLADGMLYRRAAERIAELEAEALNNRLACESMQARLEAALERIKELGADFQRMENAWRNELQKWYSNSPEMTSTERGMMAGKFLSAQARLDAAAKVQRYVVDSTVPLQITTDSEGDFMLAADVLEALEQPRG